MDLVLSMEGWGLGDSWGSPGQQGQIIHLAQAFADMAVVVPLPACPGCCGRPQENSVCDQRSVVVGTVQCGAAP